MISNIFLPDSVYKTGKKFEKKLNNILSEFPLTDYDVDLACDICCISKEAKDKNGRNCISTFFEQNKNHTCEMNTLLIRRKEVEENYIPIREWTFNKIPKYFKEFRKCKEFAKGQICKSGSLINCRFYHHEEEKQIWIASYKEKTFDLKNFISKLKEKKLQKADINIKYFKNLYQGKFQSMCFKCFSDTDQISQMFDKECAKCKSVRFKFKITAVFV